jgi:hypothetical protein
MLFKSGVVLLIAWLVGVMGLYEIGDLVHLWLLVGGLFLLLAVAKARDAAIAHQRDEDRTRKP